jgi:hypothetical protein
MRNERADAIAEKEPLPNNALKLTAPANRSAAA